MPIRVQERLEQSIKHVGLSTLVRIMGAPKSTCIVEGGDLIGFLEVA
jgi:hypothetical protein